MPDTVFDPQADDQQLLAQVVDHYHRTLKESTEGLNDLIGRGIANRESIDHFRIGLVDYSLAKRLPSPQRIAGKTIRARLRRLGLMRSFSHQHFKGCLVFPITDDSGRVVDIYGRWPGPGIKLGIPCDRFLSEVRHGVWNLQGFGDTDEVIICPSLFDALIFWHAGLRNVTCTFGPNALTEDHVTALRQAAIRRVYLMAESIAPQLRAAGIECWQLYFPHGLDVDGYVRGCPDPSRSSDSDPCRGRQGWAQLRPRHPEPEQAIQPEARWSKRPAVPMRLRLDDDQKLLAQILGHYCLALKETTEGLDYLRNRGITAGEAIDRFRIGFANKTLGRKLPTKQSKAGREIRARLQQVGFFRDTGHEHFNGCVIFPITAADGSGRIVDIYGRKIRNYLPRERLFTCTCRTSGAACGTSKRSGPATKSFFALASGTP